MTTTETLDAIDQPPTAAQVADLIAALEFWESRAFQLTARRLAFQRDHLAAELKALRERVEPRILGLAERLVAKYGTDRVYDILVRLECAAEDQSPGYIAGLIVCHESETDGG
jgi:hypothetical protein